MPNTQAKEVNLTKRVQTPPVTRREISLCKSAPRCARGDLRQRE